MLKRKIKIVGYLMLAPFLLHFIIFVVYPYIATTVYSFTNKDFKKPTSEFIGLRNYMDVLEDDVFYKVLYNTAIWQIFVPIGCVVFGLILALLLNQKIKGNSVFRTATYIPAVVDWIAVSIVFSFILDPSIGLVNYLITSLGYPPQRLLSDPSQAMPIMILVFYWKSAGYYAVFYLGALQDVNKTLIEAASIDGANIIQRFRHITLPQIAPITVVVVIMAFVNSLKLFDPFYAMTSGGPARATSVLIFYFHEMAFGFLNIGKGSAVAVLFTVVVLLAVLVQRFLLGFMKGAEGSN